MIPGDWLDELEGAVEVGGFTDGLFRWPTRSKRPPFADSLRRPAARGTYRMPESVQFWWGFSPSLVGRWRRALGVTRRNNPGDQAVRARAARPLAGPQGAAEGTGRLVQRRSRVHPPPWQQAQPGLVCLQLSAATTRVSPARPRSPHSGRDRNNAIWSKSEEDLLRQHYQQRAARYGARSRPARPAQRYSTGPEAGPATAAAETPVRPVAAPLRRGERASAQPR